MWRLSFLNRLTNEIEQKSFKDTKEAMNWIRANNTEITPLKLMVWDEDIQSFGTYRSFI